MSKACIFLADGFEEIEALTVVDLLRRAKITVDMVSITGQLQVEGRSHINVMADCLFEDVKDFDDVDMLVLPGGMPGTTYLDEYEPLKKLITSFNEKGKKIAAICAAPTILGKMGLLKGKEATCYPGMEDQLLGASWVEKKAVVDGNITTSRGPGTTVNFALKLIEQLDGETMADEIKEDIVFLHK